MAYTVTQADCKGADIATTLDALWTAASVTTHHESFVVKVGSDRFIVGIVYE